MNEIFKAILKSLVILLLIVVVGAVLLLVIANIGANQGQNAQVSFNQPMIITNIHISSDIRLPDGMKPSDYEQKAAEALAKEKSDAVRYARNAIFYINHLNMVLSKILTYNNPAVLEEEYNAISLNSIRLDTIKDEEVIDIIQDIMDYITEMRLQERQRAMLKEELDRGMSDALIDSFKGVNTGGAISPIGMAVNLVTSAASAGMSYRNAINNLKHEHEKELWKLDNEKIKELNKLNKDLLRSYWRIVQRYGLDDRYRVTEEQINRLFARLKDDDADRRYRFLKQNETAYMALPVYWFYRGEAALGKKQFDDALYAFNKYQDSQKGEDEFVYDPVTNMNMRACGKILRRDPTAAKAAMLLSDTLFQLRKAGRKSDYDAPETFKRQIKLILENTLDDEWSLRYYAAYLRGGELKDVEGAKNILQQTIDELESRRDSNLITWADLHHGDSMTNSNDRIVAPGDAIMRCKQLALELEARSVLGQDRDNLMRELCAREGTSAREKLFMYGAMRYKDALKYLEKDIEKIAARMGHDGSVEVDFPMSWIVNREGKMSVFLLEKRPEETSYKKDNYLENEKDPQLLEVSREIQRENPSSPYICKVTFKGGKPKFSPRAVLLSMIYDITDKDDTRKTRIVLEYGMPKDGKMGSLPQKKAAVGSYCASDDKGKWIEDCSTKEFQVFQ